MGHFFFCNLRHHLKKGAGGGGKIFLFRPSQLLACWVVGLRDEFRYRIDLGFLANFFFLLLWSEADGRKDSGIRVPIAPQKKKKKSEAIMWTPGFGLFAFAM